MNPRLVVAAPTVVDRHHRLFHKRVTREAITFVRSVILGVALFADEQRRRSKTRALHRMTVVALHVFLQMLRVSEAFTNGLVFGGHKYARRFTLLGLASARQQREPHAAI